MGLKLKKAVLALLCICLMTVNLSAAATEPEAETAKCTILQNSDTELDVCVKTNESIIVVMVCPEGKTPMDVMNVSKNSYSDVLVYNNEFTITGENEKKFKIDLGASPSGDYTLFLSESGVMTEYEFSFVRRDIKKTTFANINDAETVEEVKGYLESGYPEIGITEQEWNNTDVDYVAESVYDYIKDGNVLDSEDEGKSENVIRRGLAVGLLNNSKMDNIYEYIDAFEFDTDDAENYYKADFVTESAEKNITSRLEGLDLSVDSFYDAFTEAYVLGIVECADGYINVKKVMTAFEDEIGIDASEGSDSVFGKLAKNDFESYSELEKKFESLTESGSKGGSSGGSGGGSSGGGYNKTYNPEENVIEPAEELPTTIFTDIDDVEWAKKSIISLAEKGVVNGKYENLFCPDDNVTRYEFVKLAVVAFLDGVESADIEFEDVSPEHWAYEYVKKAYAAGIINGKSENIFDGDGNITREEMAAIIYRTAGISGIILSEYEEAKDYQFKDDEAIADYAKEAVYVLKYDEIINGIGNDIFAPSDNATRAQAAHIINNLMEL